MGERPKNVLGFAWVSFFRGLLLLKPRQSRRWWRYPRTEKDLSRLQQDGPTPHFAEVQHLIWKRAAFVMSIPYPKQTIGSCRLGFGLSYQLLHDRFGFDLGERYHRDVDYRVRTTMDIDRLAFETFGQIGWGFERPYPRISIEPFGHRFLPVMYGCDCVFTEDAEP